MKALLPLVLILFCSIANGQTTSSTSRRPATTTFAGLGTPANKEWRWCSDCSVGVPCTGSGSGAFAYRAGGAWNCTDHIAAGGSSTGANPTGTVGLTAVNGALTTFMRSDAAPPLSQAIAPDWTAAHKFSKNGALSLPTVHVSGSPITGGSATTTKPLVLIETAGATSAAWNTAGTMFSVNAPSGFTGMLGDLQLNGVSKFSVASDGSIVSNSGLSIGAATSLVITSRGRFGATADGVFRLVNTATTGLDRLMLGPSGTAFVALAPSGTNGLLDIRLADDSAFADVQLRQLYIDGTITAGGTTGAQTINKAAGTVNFAAAATSLVVTNSLVTANSIVFGALRTNDTTCRLANIVPAVGSFTINMTAACNAETSVGFHVINQ